MVFLRPIITICFFHFAHGKDPLICKLKGTRFCGDSWHKDSCPETCSGYKPSAKYCQNKDGRTINSDLPCRCPKDYDTTNECATGTAYCNPDGTCKEAAAAPVECCETPIFVVNHEGWKEWLEARRDEDEISRMEEEIPSDESSEVTGEGRTGGAPETPNNVSPAVPHFRKPIFESNVQPHWESTPTCKDCAQWLNAYPYPDGPGRTYAFREAENNRVMQRYKTARLKNLENEFEHSVVGNALVTVQKLGDYYYNVEKKSTGDVWRRTTLAEYRKEQPAWETVLDVRELEKRLFLVRYEEIFHTGLIYPELEYMEGMDPQISRMWDLEWLGVLILNGTRCIIQLAQKTIPISYSFEFDLDTKQIVTGPEAFKIEATLYINPYQWVIQSVSVRDENTIWWLSKYKECFLVRRGRTEKEKCNKRYIVEAMMTTHGHEVIVTGILGASAFNIKFRSPMRTNDDLPRQDGEIGLGSTVTEDYLQADAEFGPVNYLNLPRLWPTTYHLEKNGFGISFNRNHIIMRLMDDNTLFGDNAGGPDFPGGSVVACERKQWLRQAACFRGSFRESSAYRSSISPKCLRAWSDLCTVLFKPSGMTSTIGFTISKRRVTIQILDSVRARVISWKYTRRNRHLPAPRADSAYWHMDNILGESIVGSYNIQAVEASKTDDLWIIKKEFLRMTFHLFEAKNIDICASRIDGIEEIDLKPSACANGNVETECVYNTLTSSCESTAGPVLKEKRVLDDELTRNIKVEQIWVNSADGTRVPYYLIRDKRTTLPVRTLLHGYGFFGVKIPPTFLPTVSIAWLKRGYAYAVVNSRGGSELGFDWWQSAVRENQGKTYEDFIAVAQHLLDTITTPSRLAIHGRSAGGLLVADMMVKKPEMFGAILSENPVIDFQKIIGIHEDNYKGIVTSDMGRRSDLMTHPMFYLNLSPLHNLKAGQPYPPILLVAGTQDNIAHPYHGRIFKYTMKKLGYENTTWLYEDENGTHGEVSREEGQGLTNGAFMKALQFEFLLQNLQE